MDRRAAVAEGSTLEELTQAATGGSVIVPAPSSSPVVTVIEAERPRTRVELRELWHTRELALNLALRDVKVRYKQTLIGVAWALIQPLMTMVVFTFIFGRYANFPSQNLPYQVFVFLGILPWTFFSSMLIQISGTVMANRTLVQKVYFPRLILPISGTLVPAVDFACSIAVLFGLMLWFGVHPRATSPLALLFLLLLMATALGVGSVLATVNARFRDVPYAVPFLVQIMLYASPVIYPTASLPHKWQVLLAFNPVVAGIGGFRWALAGTPPPPVMTLAIGSATAVAVLLIGFLIFRANEQRFADIV